MQPSTHSPVGTPHLQARSADYYRVIGELEPVLAWLRARPDLHEWTRAATDRQSHKEVTRFFEKPPGYRGRIPMAGIVIDREGLSTWLRLVGDTPRVRRIVELLCSSSSAEIAEVQACLF